MERSCTRNEERKGGRRHRRGRSAPGRGSAVVVGLACGLLGICVAPGRARADLEDRFSFGVGVHAAYQRGRGTPEHGTAAGGMQLRLKMLGYMELGLAYDFGRDKVVETDRAETLAQLVPYPDIKLTLGIHPVPNRFLSPYILGGVGANTGTGVGSPVLVGGIGVETAVAGHLVVGAAVQVFYATPSTYARFKERMESRGEKYPTYKFVTPHSYQLTFGLTYFL